MAPIRRVGLTRIRQAPQVYVISWQTTGFRQNAPSQPAPSRFDEHPERLAALPPPPPLTQIYVLLGVPIVFHVPLMLTYTRDGLALFTMPICEGVTGVNVCRSVDQLRPSSDLRGSHISLVSFRLTLGSGSARTDQLAINHTGGELLCACLLVNLLWVP